MQELNLHQSRILIGEAAENAAQYLPNAQVIVITDANVRRHFGHIFTKFPVIEIGLGEANKTLQTLSHIASELIRLEADRTSFILGVGGGIVCDVAGFAASMFMRGLPFGFVSTTLLSQVDASVGGKNGVNHEGYKNMLGVFAQPRFVICDPHSFDTLPQREFVAGFAEIVKAAMLGNAALFAYLESHAQQALSKDSQVLERVVYEAVKIKADIVSIDEREQGERRKLNLGHTFGHAIEKHATHVHGEAVSIGLAMASQLSVRLGLMSEAEAQRVATLLTRLGLPTRTDIPHPTLLAAMRKDKKKIGHAIHLVLPVGIGNCEVREVELEGLEI
jgi:3-dehydroquinate synthase